VVFRLYGNALARELHPTSPKSTNVFYDKPKNEPCQRISQWLHDKRLRIRISLQDNELVTVAKNKLGLLISYTTKN
jgi:hypothetical protein